MRTLVLVLFLINSMIIISGCKRGHPKITPQMPGTNNTNDDNSVLKQESEENLREEKRKTEEERQRREAEERARIEAENAKQQAEEALNKVLEKQKEADQPSTSEPEFLNYCQSTDLAASEENALRIIQELISDGDEKDCNKIKNAIDQRVNNNGVLDLNIDSSTPNDKKITNANPISYFKKIKVLLLAGHDLRSDIPEENIDGTTNLKDLEDLQILSVAHNTSLNLAPANLPRSLRTIIVDGTLNASTFQKSNVEVIRN